MRSGNSSSPGWGGRIGILLFGLVFALGGCFLGYSIGRDALAGLEARSWRPTQATVLTCEVVPGKGSEAKHHLAIRYEYRWNSQTISSEQFERKPTTDEDISKIERLAAEYPAGKQVTCYVNPDKPTEAVIRRGSYFRLLGTLFAVPFIGIGLVCVYAGLHRPKAAASKPVSSISSQASNANQAGCLVIFFGIFALFGVGFFYGFFIRPVWKIYAARNWTEIPCVVESSEVRRHSSDKGSTYSVDILFRYEVNGHEFRANRYSFVTGSSSGRAGKLAIVRQYPPGRKTTCFVNPTDPTEAVLERRFTNDMWLGLIPLVFLAIGIGGMVFAIRKSRSKTGSTMTRIAGRTASANEQFASPIAGERVLKARYGPRLRLVGGIVFAVIWNGIVSVFGWHVFEGFRRHRPEWFLAIFLIPFVLIGLGVIAYVVYAFLGLFNPRPKLRLRPAAIRLGENLACDWTINGAVSRIRRLTIEIEGVEEARYRRGTSTYTDKSVFVRLPVVDNDRHREFASGGVTAMLPTQYVPSFKAPNNRIYWQLKLHGEIARWPDISEEYEIEVLPPSNPQSPGSSAPVAPLKSVNELPAGGRLILSIAGDEGGSIKPGGRLTGNAEWSINQQPKSVRANLLWFTRGKGTTDAAIVETVELPVAAAGEASFGFDLPMHPLSFDGVLVSLCWAVELIVAPGDESVRVEFNLGQGSEPIRLVAVADSPIKKLFQARS